MRAPTASFLTTGLLLVSLPAVASMRPHHAATHSSLKHVSAHSHHIARSVAARKPVVSMDSERATAIQSALIKSGYMSGEPTGTWDSSTSAAMQKLQSDNGWQTKLMPDSRALIKLGLGPDQSQVQAQ